MTRITFIQPGGSHRNVVARAGLSVMETAKEHGIAGIAALCGGACACATCHVYVDAAWLGRLPEPEDIETAMLELAWERRHESRLSCQITVTAQLDGLTLTVPAQQAGVELA
jgi:2Fe-2S ferredoxin